MLGIVIGIMSVILMLSIGEAAQRYILSQISSLGSDILTIANGSKAEAGEPSLFLKETLTLKDIKKFQQQPWITLVSGRVEQSDQLTANGFDTNVSVIGTMPDGFRMDDLQPKIGSLLTTASIDGRTRDAVLGYDIADKAFGAENPIGKTVKISGQGFKVIGVMEKIGSKSFQDVDKQVYIPVTAALDLYHKKYVNHISVKTTVGLPEAKSRLTAILRDQHNIDNPNDDLSKDDFNVTTQEDAVESASQITQILQILLVSIAAISLLVGGIGIMNIMYVTVTERIKEIGLRKAIGATRGDILQQFILEAVILTALGGMIGIVVGSALSWVAIQIISTFQPGWSFAISTRGVILGVSVSVAIGLIFGYFPARKAAGLHPIEALRAE